MDFKKKSEEVWRRVFDAEGGCCDHGLIAAALEQAYREGVKAMRNAAMTDNYEEMDLGKRLGELADSLLSKSEEVK